MWFEYSFIVLFMQNIIVLFLQESCTDKVNNNCILDFKYICLSIIIITILYNIDFHSQYTNMKKIEIIITIYTTYIGLFFQFFKDYLF